MTKVTRKFKREGAACVFSRGKSRPVIVELSPPGLMVGFRLKGERRTHELPLDWLYKRAAQATVAYEKAERARQRKEARAH